MCTVIVQGYLCAYVHAMDQGTVQDGGTQEPQNANILLVDDTPNKTISPFIMSASRRPDQNVTYIERPEDLLFIAELIVNGDISLDSGLLIYLDENSILIPLSVMVRHLQFSIEVDNANGIAKGWFIDQNNDFLLEYPFEQVTVNGKKRDVIGQVESHIDDIYVSIEEFSRWFPVSLEFNFNELRLYLESDEKLAFEEAAERASRWRSIASHRRAERDVKSELENAVFLPYKMLSYPSVQVSNSVSYAKSGGGGEADVSYSTNIQSYNDILGHSANINATLSNSSENDNNNPVLSNVLINLSKQDVRGIYLDLCVRPNMSWVILVVFHCHWPADFRGDAVPVLQMRPPTMSVTLINLSLKDLERRAGTSKFIRMNA